MARNYSDEYEARQERAHELGWDSDAERREYRTYVRDEWDMDALSRMDPRIEEAAEFARDYVQGDEGYDDLLEQWKDWHDYPDDWEPADDDDFWDFLEDLSGEAQ